jgi:hypothetical protein
MEESVTNWIGVTQYKNRNTVIPGCPGLARLTGPAMDSGLSGHEHKYVTVFMFMTTKGPCGKGEPG